MNFMIILENLNHRKIEIIKSNLHLFESFEKVFLFGSVLDSTRFPNDIDILVIYKEYTNEIQNEITKISKILEEKTGLPIDFTVLSVEEERSTSFLEKVGPNNIELK